MKRGSFLFSIVATGLLLFVTGCGSVRNVAYLQTENLITKISVADTFELHIQPDDILDITVSSVNKEVTEPFNLQISQTGNFGGNSNYTYNNAQGFLVDKDGYINYPVLGKIKVGGLTRRKLISLLQNKLISGHYVKDPIVLLRLLNFSITILGEVSRPGTYNIDKEKITLFDALGLAGDLSLYGRRDRVAVIRERNGIRTILYHDLRTLDVMNSPFYYLEQNDVVYVEPNRVKGEQSSQNQFSNVGTWVSLVNFLTTMGLLIFK